MRLFIRYTVVILFLVSYVFLGAIGHLEVLTVLGFGTNPHMFTQAKAGHPQTTKVYWTQYKHIPTTVKISAPSPVILVNPEKHHAHAHRIVYTTGNPGTLSESFVSFHSSRAPPKI